MLPRLAGLGQGLAKVWRLVGAKLHFKLKLGYEDGTSALPKDDDVSSPRMIIGTSHDRT